MQIKHLAAVSLLIFSLSACANNDNDSIGFFGWFLFLGSLATSDLYAQHTGGYPEYQPQESTTETEQCKETRSLFRLCMKRGFPENECPDYIQLRQSVGKCW